MEMDWTTWKPSWSGKIEQVFHIQPSAKIVAEAHFVARGQLLLHVVNLEELDVVKETLASALGMPSNSTAAPQLLPIFFSRKKRVIQNIFHKRNHLSV